MQDTSNQQIEELPEEEEQSDPVNRARRFCYVAAVTLSCLGGMLWLVESGAEGKVAEIIADALGSVAIFVVVSYLGASTIDYSVPNLRWGSRKKNLHMSRDNSGVNRNIRR